MGDFCDLWIESTKLDHLRIQSRRVKLADKPPAAKHYDSLPRIDLPSPAEIDIQPADLWEALHLRRSVRKYAKAPMTLAQLSCLLWSAQGVTARQSPYLLRPAPSAGALYPFETYLVVNNVEGLEQGLYHFDVESFSLAQIKTGDLGLELTKACLGQNFMADAPVSFVWTAIPERCTWKYGDRASRYIGLDIGHVCQSLCLGAVGLGLGSCAVGAFLDNEANALVGVDGEGEFVFYLAAVGAPRR